jgi:hypothetical protein
MGHYAQQHRGERLRPLRDYSLGNQKIREMSEVEVAWMAGLLEGEGYFARHQGLPRIQLQMTDFDIIERAKEITGGCGSISKATDPRGGRKQAKRWELTGERAAILMERILPHMGSRRAEKIAEVVNV